MQAQESRTSTGAAVYLAFFISIATICGIAAGSVKQPAVPLLVSPINATWAANHADDWYEKGIRGFLFRGILDDLRLFPSEHERLVHTESLSPVETYDGVVTPTLGVQSGYGADIVIPGDWDELTREISGAVNRLRAGGVDRNFLHISLSPEAPYFINDTLAEIAEQRLRLAGALSAAAGLRGIAINTQSNSAIFNYLWDGYPPDYDAQLLADNARRFASRILRAYIRAHPDGELLLLAGRPESAGPLWFPFIEGAFTSVGAAHTIPIRLAFLDHADTLNPQFHRDYSERVRRLFRQRLSGAAAGHWQKQGGLVFGLEPIHHRQDIPTARYPLDAYRGALHAAALYGVDYVLLLAPEGGWWHIPPDTAEQFTHLKQGGAARVRFAPPVPRALDAFMPRLHFLGADYIGPLRVQDNEAEVLRNEQGAGLLFWDDVEAELDVVTRRGIVVATDLTSDNQRFFIAREGKLRLPPLPGPVLVEGLSMRDFALPASIWLDASAPVSVGITREELRFGIRNPLDAPLRGTLTLVSEPRYSLGAATFPLDLKPGGSHSFHRRMQGLSYLGQRPVFSLNLTTGTGASVQRDLVLTIEPEEKFRVALDAPPTGPPALWPPPGTGETPVMFLLDARGALCAYDIASNALLWRKRLRGTYRLPPVLLQDETGAPRVAAINEHGRARLFDLVGTERAHIYLDGAESVISAAVAAPGSNTVSLVAGLQQHKLVCHAATGRQLWQTEADIEFDRFIHDGSLPGMFYIYGRPSSTGTYGEKEQALAILAAYDHEGGRVWELLLEYPALSEPALFVAPKTRGLSILCVGDISGRLICVEAITGKVIAEKEMEEPAPMTHFTAFRTSETNTPWAAYTTADSVVALPLTPSDERGDRMARKISEPTALAVLPDRDGIVVGTADGAVYAAGLDGRLHWESHTAGGAVRTLTLFSDPTVRNAYYCIAVAEDHLARVMHVRDDLIRMEKQPVWPLE